MALVSCKECGSQVADSAPMCPKCGVTNPAGRTAHVVVSRKSQMTAAASRVEVYIDDQLLGAVKSGKSATFDVSPGEHELTVVCTAPVGTQWVRQSGFEVGGGQTVGFECGNYGLKGFNLKRA